MSRVLTSSSRLYVRRGTITRMTPWVIRVLLGSVVAVVGLGCADEFTPIPPGLNGVESSGDDANPAVAETGRDAPLLGGTLLVTRDGLTAVAADPDRDSLFLADLETGTVTALVLDDQDRPGRLVEGPDGIVFAIARGNNALVRVDVASGTSTRRDQICGAPMGIDYDPATEQIVVACRSGQLVNLDPDSLQTLRALTLDDDLRDVVVQGSELVVTRFRTTQITVVNPAGNATRLGRLAEPVASFAVDGAFRTVAVPGGGVAIVHQEATNQTLTPSATLNVAAYYGGSSGCSQPILAPAISVIISPFVNTDEASFLGTHSTLDLTRMTRRLGGATGPLDIALSQDGSRLALLAMGNIWSARQERPRLYVMDREQALIEASPVLPDACGNSPDAAEVTGQPVAVAFDAQGRYIVQSREPATLQLEDGRTLQLSQESRSSTALSLFYKNNGSGVSCAACHLDAEDDGHTWMLDEFGARRTQTLVGVSDRAPFHWGGELATFRELIDEVMVQRMAFPTAPSEGELNAVQSWLDRLPVADLAPALDPDAVARGAALFRDEQVGCSGCHQGPTFTDGQRYDVDTGGTFVTPSLLGVGLRAPLMHDGCAVSLRDRFGGCGGDDRHGTTSSLSTTQLDDLVSFMRSL
jgi:hypothetical protein